METLERKKLEASISRAHAAIADYEVRLLEREIDIERINTEIGQQKKGIEELKLKLKGEE